MLQIIFEINVSEIFTHCFVGKNFLATRNRTPKRAQCAVYDGISLIKILRQNKQTAHKHEEREKKSKNKICVREAKQLATIAAQIRQVLHARDIE